jgi:hypothetical protein
MAVSERSLKHRDTWLQPSCAKEKQSSNKTIAHSHQQRWTLTLPCTCTKFLFFLLFKLTVFTVTWIIQFRILCQEQGQKSESVRISIYGHFLRNSTN